MDKDLPEDAAPPPVLALPAGGAAIPPHTLDVLEFGKLLPELIRRAESAWGQELAAAVRPAPDIAEARARASLIAEWLRLAAGAPAPPSPAVPDVREALDLAATHGAVLEGETLLDVARAATTSRLLGEVLAARAADAPALAAAAAPSWVASRHRAGGGARSMGGLVR
jgi:dsDNA-specific endonuclease/ATPase MutS2